MPDKFDLNLEAKHYKKMKKTLSEFIKENPTKDSYYSAVFTDLPKDFSAYIVFCKGPLIAHSLYDQEGA